MSKLSFMPIQPLQRLLRILWGGSIFHGPEFFNHAHSRHPLQSTILLRTAPAIVPWPSLLRNPLQPFLAIFSRHVSNRFSSNFNRSRPHFVRITTFSISTKTSGSPSFSRSSARNG